MADPAYIDSDGVLTDGEAWVALETDDVTSDAVVQFLSTNDGQVGDWSQYMDLIIVAYARTDYASTSASAIMHLNNDTTSNYAQQLLYGGGAAAAASSATTNYMYMAWTAGNLSPDYQFGGAVITLHDINSGKYKSVRSQFADDRDGTGYAGLFAHTWKSHAAVTEIDITGWGGANFLAGSYFSLFGVLPRMMPGATTTVAT